LAQRGPLAGLARPPYGCGKPQAARVACCRGFGRDRLNSAQSPPTCRRYRRCHDRRAGQQCQKIGGGNPPMKLRVIASPGTASGWKKEVAGRAGCTDRRDIGNAEPRHSGSTDESFRNGSRLGAAGSLTAIYIEFLGAILVQFQCRKGQLWRNSHIGAQSRGELLLGHAAVRPAGAFVRECTRQNR
jgi:hypothetical protein